MTQGLEYRHPHVLVTNTQGPTISESVTTKPQILCHENLSDKHCRLTHTYTLKLDNKQLGLVPMGNLPPFSNQVQCPHDWWKRSVHIKVGEGLSYVNMTI